MVSLHLGVLWGDGVWNECCEIRSVAGLKISWVSPAGRLKTYLSQGGAWIAFFQKRNGGGGEEIKAGGWVMS